MVPPLDLGLSVASFALWKECRSEVGCSCRNANRAALTGRPIRLRANGGRATKTAAASGH